MTDTNPQPDHNPFIYNDLEGASITFHGGARDDDGQDTVAVEADQIGRGHVWVHVRHTDAARVADELRAAAGLPRVLRAEDDPAAAPVPAPAPTDRAAIVEGPQTVTHNANQPAVGRSPRAAEAELYVLLRKAGEDRHEAQALIDRHRDEVLRRVAAEAQQPEAKLVPCVRPEAHPAHLHSGLRNGVAVHGRCPGEAWQPETCGRTWSVSGHEYPPCARPVGHREAYCRSADGRAHFLGTDDIEPAAVSQPGKEG
jgi:hypothetical protein